jgi:DNA-binding NarL/FixJ family response regulator
MNKIAKTKLPRVMIASSNPLFGMSLQSLLVNHYHLHQSNIIIISNTAEAILKMSQWNFSLIILDNADKQIDKVEFLNHFVEGSQSIQLMLVSLQSSGPAIVYERHSISPDQIIEWLDLSWKPEK